MDALFSRMTKRYTPPMNREVMEGLAVSSMKYVEEYLDAQIRSVCDGLPNCVTYVGYERCTSQEEYEEVTKVRGNRRSYNLARSTIYLAKYYLCFTDAMGKQHIITRYICLPYVDQAGIMSSSGNKYHIVPVLSDKVFTPGKDSIFVRLIQDRINMFRIYHTAKINGKREARYVVWATIYRNQPAVNLPATTKAKTLLIHYLFANYGFTEAFRRYAHCTPVLGGEEITSTTHPATDWVICESTGVKPMTCLDRGYIATKLRLAIRKEDWSPEAEALVMGLFYVVDHFPHRFKPEGKHTWIDYLNDTSLWMILIGHIRFSGLQGENKLYAAISEHFESLVGYLDTGVKDKLAEKGIVLDNYYDLLQYIQMNFNDMLRQNEKDGLCVYGKNLEVLYYVLYDIIYGFVMVKFKLNKIANKRPLTLKDVTENLHRQVKMGAIFRLTTGKIVTEAVSYSGDHMYPKITAIVAEQENRAGAARGKADRVTPGPQHWLDLSMVTVGSVLNLPKSNPTPVARINPWVTIDSKTGTVLPNPKFEQLIAENKPRFKL